MREQRRQDDHTAGQVDPPRGAGLVAGSGGALLGTALDPLGLASAALSDVGAEALTAAQTSKEGALAVTAYENLGAGHSPVASRLP